MTTLRFLGAVRQVTGSSCLLESDGARILVDCGIYQERPFLGRNWEAFPFEPGSIDAVLLTHAHMDHGGLLPKLVRDGFRGPILTTGATADLLSIMLLDSARLQEEDAAYKRKRHQREGRTAPHPEVALYTVEDATAMLPQVRPVAYDRPVEVAGGIAATFRDAGHILGSAMIEVAVPAGGAARTVVFSGDIGQWNKPLVRDPTLFARADAVVMESTYGDRAHRSPESAPEEMARIIRETAAAGGNVVVPTFAMERAQELLFHVSRMVREGRVPPIPVYLDSPMGIEITEAFARHMDVLDEETLGLIRDRRSPFEFPGLRLARDGAESKAINDQAGACVIMAGSGMCTGGRIKHHLVRNIGRPESTILFVGYQASDTLGRQIQDGTPRVRIFGQEWPVRARIRSLPGFSAHADRDGLLRWLKGFREAPGKLFVGHGERAAAASFAATVEREMGWAPIVPGYMEVGLLGW